MKKFLTSLLSAVIILSLAVFPISAQSFTTTDALNILKAAAGTITLTAEQQAQYDINGDGKIDTADALAALRIVAGQPAANTASSPSATAAVGSIIKFGDYDWRVLDVKDGTALIITEKVLDVQRYHSAQVDITWADCDLRAYLNGEFYNSFNQADQVRILNTTLTTNTNPKYTHTESGADTEDKIFALSIEEVIKYFGGSDEINGEFINNDKNHARQTQNAEGYNQGWWLRSPGYIDKFASNVVADGTIYVYGKGVNSFEFIRPAMWVTL